MKHYTDTIPVNLAEKLKEKGMPLERWDGINQEPLIIRIMEESAYDWLDEELGNEPSKEEVLYCVPTYAEVFDWFRSKKNIGISIKDHWSGIVYQGWDWQVCQFNKSITPYFGTFYGTWHEAANAAIEKALELI